MLDSLEVPVERPQAPGSPRGKTILVVDDDLRVREAVGRLVEHLGHRVEFAADGFEALAKLALDVDLVLLDAHMPGMDGFEVTRRIRAHPEHFDLPIVMCTGASGPGERLLAAEAGVNDFICKPIQKMELSARTRTLLQLKEATDALKRHRDELEATVRARTESLRRALEESAAARRELAQALENVRAGNQKLRGSYEETVLRLALAAEHRSDETFDHLQRVGRFCETLARRLRMPEEFVEDVRLASMLHDIGKLGLSDSSLSDRAEGERHTVLGADILEGSASSLLQMGEAIARWHHERWDGGGYPDGLSEERIPLPARIVAVADALEERLARGMGVAEAAESLQAEAGRSLDPDLTALVMGLTAELDEIRSTFPE